MGRKKKAQKIDSHLRIKTTAQLEKEVKDLLTIPDPDPDTPLDMSNAREWCEGQRSPPHYIDGEPYNEEERKKQEAYDKQRPR